MSSTPDLDPKALSDLVFALAGPGATVAAHVTLCEQLWNDSYHHGWIAASLIRKASLVNDEPDEASVNFLARHCSADLTGPSFEAPPSPEQIVECLPSLILLLPEDAWDTPFSLWPALLATVCEEFGLPAGALPSLETIASDPQAEALAALFSDTIGVYWTEDLDHRLDEWRGRSEFAWLVALRQSARLRGSLEALSHQLRIPNPFERVGLAQQLQSLSPFERRRWLVFRRKDGEEHLLAEPRIDPRHNTVDWLFRIPLAAGEHEHLSLIADERSIGEIRLHRIAGNQIEIEQATGVLTSLSFQIRSTLKLVKAASDQSVEQEMIPLAGSLQGLIQPTESGAIANLRWRPQESSDD